MTLYVIDTDHLSLFERNHPAVVSRIFAARRSMSDELATTVVSMEEQLAGRLAQIRKRSDSARLIFAYERLKMTFEMFAGINILDYGATADNHFRNFRKGGIRIGTQDLRIASIVIAQNAVLVTRNLRDFEKVPGLFFQDWSVEE